mmetsp:Transcript_3209/g.19885  ORF Transcript_3209/g.19885 Transcript_3209/m.19885 type:complete len:356 (-) Transcript_3209:2367-3434(-)
MRNAPQRKKNRPNTRRWIHPGKPAPSKEAKGGRPNGEENLVAIQTVVNAPADARRRVRNLAYARPFYTPRMDALLLRDHGVQQGKRLLVGFQQQRRTHHAHRRKRHGATGHPRRELELEGWIQDPRGDRDPQHVVSHGPHVVHLDALERRPRQVNRRQYVLQVVLHQDEICRFQRDVRARPDGNPQIRRCQRRRIVDAIAHHGNPVTAGLQASHLVRLAGGRNLRHHVHDAQMVRDGPGCPPVVPRDHVTQYAHPVELPDYHRSLWLYRIADGEGPSQHPIGCEEHARHCLLLGLGHEPLRGVVDEHPFRLHEPAIAEQHPVRPLAVSDRARDALAWYGHHVFRRPDPFRGRLVQ